MKRIIKIASCLCLLISMSSFNGKRTSNINSNRITHLNTIEIDSILPDSIATDSSTITYIPFKENVHASYYHNKFTGRKTANGEIFDNNLYTAAHKTLEFGTKVRVTNTVNGKSVMVTINDRGPFVKGREIDLSKKAFMEIAKYKQRGYLIVILDILENP